MRQQILYHQLPGDKSKAKQAPCCLWIQNQSLPQTYTHNHTGASLVKGSSQLSMHLYIS